MSPFPPDSLEILRSALLVRATKIILIHNHPVGSVEPSAADIKAAKNLKEQAAVLKIGLRDELIIGEDGFVSLMERGLL